MRKKTAAVILAAALLSLAGCQAGDSVSRIVSEIENTVKEESGGRIEETESAQPLKEWNIWQSQDGGKEEDSEKESRNQEQEVSRSAGRYAYTTLKPEEQKTYDEIYQALLDHTEKISVETLDIEVMDRAYKAVVADYGELFWASGYAYTRYTRGNTPVGLEFEPKYTMSRESQEAVQQQIRDAAEKIISGISMEASDYEKAKYIYEYLISNVEYKKNAKDNQNIISALLYRETVCQGYASATQYLLSLMGIQSAIVTGTADGEPHAWNLARLDGEYYYIDTTWGNSTYAGTDTGLGNFVNYAYFGITSKEMGMTHQANDYVTLPDCTANQDNYYIREGKYVSEWKEETIGALYRSAYEGGLEMVSLKFASKELFEKTKSYFIDEQHISDYCKGLTSIYYVKDQNLNILTISFS